MKYSLECKVDSNMAIDSEITYHEKDKTFILIPDEKKNLSSIRIIAKIHDPTLFDIAFESHPEKREHALTVKFDTGLHEDLIHEFQHLESILAFPKVSLKKIHWENPKQEFIPETQEEEKELKVINVQWTKSYPENSSFLSKENFIEIMENRDKYKKLTIPISFFREGTNEYNTFRYINAFYNFYFVIEDLYGGGKCQNRDVEQELKKSDEFRSFVQWMIDDIQNHDARHFDNISKYLNWFRKNFDVDGLIFIIVRMRGQLHHYSEKNTQIQGTPFNQKDFESFAYLTLGVALRGILQKILEINIQGNKI